MTDDECSTVLVTFPDRSCASTIIAHLLDAHLIACANLLPIESSYWWEGRVEQSEEWMALMKIRSSDFPLVQESILRHHPYQVPCIVRYGIAQGHPPYLDWVIASTARPLGD